MLAAFSLYYANTNNKNVQNGVVDISEWDGNSLVELSGVTDFFWNKLVYEKDLQKGVKPDIQATIPAVWNYYIIDGKRLSGFGYGTYRIHVTGADPGMNLALRIQPLSTAFDIYIDDKLMTSCGVVGMTAESAKPEYAIRSFDFTPPNSSFDIIIHVANFTYARGGAWYAPYLGTSDKISGLNRGVFDVDLFYLGFYILILLYNVVYYIINRDKKFLIFIISCVVIASRTLTTGSYLLNVFPFASYNSSVYIIYITLYLMPTCWLVQAYTSFSMGISKTIVKIAVISSVALIVISFFVSVFVITSMTYALEAGVLCIGLYLLYKSIYAIVANTQKKPLDLYLVLFGTVSVMICSIRDIFYQNNIFQQGLTEIAPIGVMLLALSWNLAFMYRNEILLRDRLRVLEELTQANEREREIELKYLKSQIRPHFIHNALSAIISVSRTDIDQTRELLYEFSNYLRSCYDLGRLEDAMPIENEIALVRSYVALEQARYGANLIVEYKIEDINMRIPPLILQPLVENAIIHNKISKDKPLHVTVYVIKTVDHVKLGVTDDGEGFPNENIMAQLNEDIECHGVGLYNINQRLEKIYGTTLQIEHIEGGGSNVYMIL